MYANELKNIQVGDVLSYKGNEYEVVKEDEHKFLSYQKLPNGKWLAINLIKSYLPLYVQNGLKVK